MLFEITNTNARDPLISGGRQYTFTIYLQPFKYGEGTASFKDSKFQRSDALGSVLDEFLSHVDQTLWTGYDASMDSVTADDMTITSDDNEVGISEIVRADTTEFTADSELTADDQLGIWNDSAEDVLDMIDDRLAEYADNAAFECEGEKIIINDSNPFGFM
jgi:hypothetical protein